MRKLVTIRKISSIIEIKDCTYWNYTLRNTNVVKPFTRKLITIQQITGITDTPGADLIASAAIQGWQVIVKKSEFKVNDYYLFCC